MIHHCNLHCHTIDPVQLENLSIEDNGKWLPFSFHMDMVMAVKLTSDEIDDKLFNCTTLFTEAGDTFIIDTPYKRFSHLYSDYHQSPAPETKEPEL